MSDAKKDIETSTVEVLETNSFQTSHLRLLVTCRAHVDTGRLFDVEAYTLAELERAAKATVVAEKRAQPIVYLTDASSETIRQLIALMEALSCHLEASADNSVMNLIHQTWATPPASTPPTAVTTTPVSHTVVATPTNGAPGK